MIFPRQRSEANPCAAMRQTHEFAPIEKQKQDQHDADLRRAIAAQLIRAGATATIRRIDLVVGD
jgi:hypothetical protein